MEQETKNESAAKEPQEEVREEACAAGEAAAEKPEDSQKESEKDAQKENPEQEKAAGPQSADSQPGEDASQGGSAHKKKEKSGKLFGRKDERDEKIEELQDRLKRNMAEFENFRKRTEKEKAAMYDVGAREIIEKVLPVLDNFERGINTMPEEEKGTPFAEGMVMIYKQLAKTLEDAGVEVIEAEGKTFDPQLHNAVMHIEDDKYGENVVSQELQKGYKYHGTVIRHSLVQVAN